MNIHEKIDNLSTSQLKMLSTKLNEYVDGVSKTSANKLVAYIVADQLLPPTTEELREKVAKSLPAYMVPQDIVFVENIPLSPNGKTDLSALQRILNDDEATPSYDFVEPRNDVEKVVSNMWAEALGAEIIGVNDNFFEVGGDSMLSASLIANMREAFEVDIPLRYLFEAPTVSAMCMLILNDESISEIVKQNAELITQLDSMSDDEVEALLNQDTDDVEEIYS